MSETTSLGAAMAAAITMGLFSIEKLGNPQDLNASIFKPDISKPRYVNSYQKVADVLQEMMETSVIICLLINFMLDVLCDSDTPGDMFPR